uniref:Uncharacterized protein n=1 Tax=Tetranychus urticae TaxID=32264 RepID=T1JWF0_TETUR
MKLRLFCFSDEELFVTSDSLGQFLGQCYERKDADETISWILNRKAIIMLIMFVIN